MRGAWTSGRWRALAIGALLVLLAACSAPAPPGGASAGTGQVLVTASSAEGDRLAGRPPLRFGPRLPPEDSALVTVDDAARYQRIAGFGASFLEAGLVTLNTLPGRSAQDAVLRSLFDARAGAGFSVMKTPIAATDFMSASPRWYTYDDTPQDTALEHFSIARDLGPDGLVTYIRRARAAGGSFLLQAPMDYPPDWMLKDAVSDQDVDPRHYQALADYYVRYLQAYERAGIHVDYLSPFNEPGGYTKIGWAEIRDLIRDHLGPTFQRDRVTTRIQLGEQGDRTSAARCYPVVLDDPGARAFVASMAYHGYDWKGWDDIAALHERHPDIPMWMTELCCAFDQAAGQRFDSGPFWAGQVISDLEAGASAWIYWNAILDETGGPWLSSPVHNDAAVNPQNSVVVIDRAKHTVTYTGLYWFLAHFSKFVRPGATRVGSTRPAASAWLREIAFQNADGWLVTQLVNSGPDPGRVQLDWRGRSLRLTLPAVSITTLRWRP